MDMKFVHTCNEQCKGIASTTQLCQEGNKQVSIYTKRVSG